MTFKTFPLTPPQDGPVPNGCLRLKRRIGNSWAGLVLNNHQNGPRFNSMGRAIRSTDVVLNSPALKSIVRFRQRIEKHTLVVYNDSSALLVKESITPFSDLEVLPLPLYLPKDFTLEGRKTSFSLTDWMEPTEVPSLSVSVGIDIREQMERDAQWWASQGDNISFQTSHSSGNEADRPKAWFVPYDKVKASTAERLSTLLWAITDAYERPTSTLILHGRSVDATGKLSKLKIEHKHPSMFWRTRKNTIETIVNHPKTGLTPEDTLRQGYINLKANTWHPSGFAGQEFCQSHKPSNAHDQTLAKRMLHDILKEIGKKLG